MSIQGLDMSSPDDIVKDGACSELHNLRWKDNAWRPVHKHKEINKYITSPLKETIVYHHPIAGENTYIFLRKPALLNSTYDYYSYDVTKTAVGDEGASSDAFNANAILLGSFNEEQDIRHFGNILVFSGADKITNYIYRKGTYRVFNSPYSPRISISNTGPQYHALPNMFRVSTTIRRLRTIGAEDIFIKDTWYHSDRLGEAIRAVKDWNDAVAGDSTIEGYDPISPTYTCLWLLSDADKLDTCIPTVRFSDAGEQGATSWHGEVALFAAYHTADGTITTPSPLSICLSDNTAPNVTFKQEAFFSLYNSEATPDSDADRRYIGCEASFAYSTELSVGEIRLHCPYNYILPTLTIDIDSRVSTDIITGFALYATRINPIFNPAYYATMNGDVPMNKLWAQNKLPEQPFYMVKEFNLSPDISGDYATRYHIQLDSLILQQAIHNKVYTPSVPHDIDGNVAFDYNNSLHLGNVRTYFNSGGVLAEALSLGTGNLLTPFIEMNIHNKAYYVKGAEISSSGAFNEPFTHIISYHDYRANGFIIKNGDNEAAPYFPMQSAIGNNISYFTGLSNDTVKYPVLSSTFATDEVKASLLPSTSDTLYEPNRIQVSAPNNCFSFPFENSYAVGSANNRILALQSAAIKIGDEKVGELPLYVFSEEGIFALRAGASTLYARVDPINYDKIINPNTLAINGAIVYITEKGVHLLSSEGTAVISTPIHGADGMPPLDFLRDCNIIWPKQYNEVVLLNDNEDRAFVFNLDAGYWSTRDLSGTKINTDELCDGKAIYDLNDEDESQSLKASIHTRPIKLGNVEFKRLETIIPRMSVGAYPIILNMDVNGSADSVSYHNLRSILNMEVGSDKVNPIVLRRTPFSAKYFDIIMGFTPMTQDDGFAPSITHIDIEWYSRFMRRMR